MAQQISIRQSFDQQLLSQIRSRSTQYRGITATSGTTLEEDPPRAVLKGEADDYFKFITSNRLPSNSGLLSMKLSFTELTHELVTEADVIRASHLYLLHPVNLAATRIMPKGYILKCRGEVFGDSSRTDIQWIVYSPNNQSQNIAVLEMKNTNVIHRGDFEPALTSAKDARNKLTEAFS